MVSWVVLLFIGLQCLPTFGTPINFGNSSWNGWIGMVGNPNAPGGSFDLGGDLYQNVSTTPGQSYDITFWAAANLYFGPSLTLDLAINGQTDATIITPPYTYNNRINRYDQMVWEQYNDSFIASSAITRIEFIDMNTYDFGLDAVSMAQVPDAAATMGLMGISVVSLMAFSRIRIIKPCT